MKTINFLVLLITITLITQSCRKDSDDFTIIPPFTQPQLSVIGSLLGTVTDENGVPLKGATIMYENKTTSTDEKGVFQFYNESMYSNGTFISVKKDGYFDGSRRFYANAGETTLVTIELIPMNNIGQFNGTSGGNITFENTELDFKANSIISRDGSPYTGNVNVAAKYLDPTLLTSMNQMPGDLTGVSKDQNLVSLTSLAMITVELYDDAGKELQVKEGEFVGTKIPVPISLQNIAPASIPMWHFDETAGRWVEEGTADYIDGFYETSLPHFSFWNCDVPRDLIFLSGSVTNNGQPSSGVHVIVSQINGGASGSAITGPNGFFSGYVPKGENLTLSIESVCGTTIYSSDIPASEIDINLEAINLSLENVINISGVVAHCNGSPSQETYINVSQGSTYQKIAINDDFTFSANIFFCEDYEFIINAVDLANVLISETIIYPSGGDINLGIIELCHENNQLIDPRDGEKYDIVEINGQIWTAQNMRYDTEGPNIWYYDFLHSELPEHYGRHYSYHSAQLVCPSGWHMAKENDYSWGLQTSPPSNLSYILKSTNDWLDDSNGSNSSGFNAYPAGRTIDGELVGVGTNAYFWKVPASPDQPADYSIYNISSDGISTILETNVGAKRSASVRCIKD